MNQILIACLIMASAAVIAFQKRAQRQIDQAELLRIRSEEQGLRSAIAELDSRSSDLGRRHAEHRAELAGITAELRAVSAAALQARPEPSPETEGRWPAGRPYFYLPKRLLDQIGYNALTPDGQPTAEAIALLGLTPHERQDLRQAWADFRFDLQELQVRSAERVPDTNAVPDPNRRSIQFRVASLTNELAQFRSQLASRVEQNLGPTRAGLLSDPLQDRIQDHTSPIGDRDLILTYHAERAADGTVQHWLRFDDTAHTVMYQYPIDFSAPNPSPTDGESQAVSGTRLPLTTDSPLWNYRHLFGDQPLLPLP